MRASTSRDLRHAAAPRHRRLLSEPLEPRILLAAISGTVFNDLDQDGVYEPQFAEGPLAGRVVYLDLNGNGRLESLDEPSRVTGGDGRYQFSNLPVGEYLVRQLSTSDWVQTPFAVSQSTIRSVPLSANDLIFNPTNGNIYASVPWSQGAIGNSVTEIDPITGTLGRSLLLGADPGQQALADNGQLLYVTVDSDKTIRAIDLNAFTAGAPFSLGTDHSGAAFRATDLEVMPGNPNTVAVGRRPYGGVAVYDNGVARPKTTTDEVSFINEIEFDQAGTMIYGLDVVSTARYFSRMTLGTTGVTTLDIMTTDVGGGMDYENGRIYGVNGPVLDPATRTTLGAVDATGMVEPATSRSLIFSMIGRDILAFDAATFQFISKMTVPGNYYPPGTSTEELQLIHWGVAGLAVRMSSAQLLLINWDPWGGSRYIAASSSDAIQAADFGNLTTAAVAKPAARDDSYIAVEDIVAVVPPSGVLSNDEAVGAPLIAVQLTAPSHGQVTLNLEGGFTYTPAVDYVGTDSFTYYVTDGVANSTPATVRITVSPDPNSPVSAGNQYSFNEDASLIIAAPGVLANDSDPNGDAITAVLETEPTHGVFTLNSNGGFSYSPFKDYNGTDRFTYRATDGSAQSHVATVTLIVRSVNDAPVAVDDGFATPKNSTLNVSSRGVLTNDTDVDSQSITAVLASQPSHGTLSLSSNGAFIYYPATDFEGTDSFTYFARDSQLNSGVPATVAISVTPVPGTPTANADAFGATEDKTLVVAAPGVLDNDSDPDSNTLSAVVSTGPAHGKLTLNSNGSLSYVPNSNYNGSDSFTYRAKNGRGNSGLATVTLSIAAVNDAPTVNVEDYRFLQETARTVPAPGVLNYAKDVDGDSLTAILVSQAQHGSLTLHADGSFDYAPDSGFVGRDSFTFRASDGITQSNVVSVRLDTESFAQVPVAVDDTFDYSEDTNSKYPAYGVLGNDTDSNNDILKAVLVSDVSHGKLTLNPVGNFVYTPDPNFTGQDHFTYRATDGIAMSNNIATVTLNILPFDDPPIANADNFVVERSQPLVVDGPGILANDEDIDTPILTASLVKNAAHGTVTLQPDGSFTYHPEAGFVGCDSFTYSVSDRQAMSGPLYAMAVSPYFGGPAQLYAISPTSGTATLVTAFNRPFELERPSGMVTLPNGRLLTLSYESLIELNPTTGTALVINDESNYPAGGGGLALSPIDGRLYAVGNQNRLLTIDPTTGVRSVVTNSPLADLQIASLAFGPSGVLYAMAMMQTQPDVLVSIDTKSGAVTAIGPTGTNSDSGYAGLAFDPKDGALYLSVVEVGAKLYRVNTATGVATLVGDMRQADWPSNQSIGWVSGIMFPSLGPQSVTTVTVDVVRTRPFFVAGADIATMDESGPQMISNWATQIAGRSHVVGGDTLRFIVTAADPSLFTVQPSIDAAGTLTFQPQANSSGVAEVTVVLADDGGTASGGSDTSLPQTFTIRIDKAHVWHNAVEARDVNADAFVVAGDALAIINYINAVGAGPVPTAGGSGALYYDVDADGFVCARDALVVINAINEQKSAFSLADEQQPELPPEGSCELSALVVLLADDVATATGKRRCKAD